MQRIIDISVGLEDNMVAWPGSNGFNMHQTSHLTANKCSNNSRIETDLHVGTHIDAPWHFIEHGKTIEQLDLNKMMGEAFVIDVGNAEEITAKLLESQSIPSDTNKILFKTKNSLLWKNNHHDFDCDYVALTADAAQWIVDHGVQLVGIDYLSIQKFNDPFATHEILLSHEVVILEGLCLMGVEQGSYKLICLPIKINGADGAPARAILIKDELKV